LSPLVFTGDVASILLLPASLSLSFLPLFLGVASETSHSLKSQILSYRFGNLDIIATFLFSSDLHITILLYVLRQNHSSSSVNELKVFDFFLLNIFNAFKTLSCLVFQPQ